MGQYTKVIVFTKSDEATVSSILTPGHRKIYVAPLPKKRPPRSRMTIYVDQCRVHDGGEPSLWLDTFGVGTPENIYANYLGRRRYCIFCWTPVSDFLKNSSGDDENVQDKPGQEGN